MHFNRGIEPTTIGSIAWMVVLLQATILSRHRVLCIKLNATAVFAFGDSTIDPGNNNWINTPAKANFGPYGMDFPGKLATGRFSNGRVSVDFISEAFGLKPIVPAYLDPKLIIEDASTGVNFASSGAGYDDKTSKILNALSMTNQLQHFKECRGRILKRYGQRKGKKIIANAVYILGVGTNDFVENYFPLRERREQFSIDEYMDFLIVRVRDFMTELYNLGARRISQVGISPVGCTPLERFLSGGILCRIKYNVVAKQYNVKLSELMAELNRTLPGSTFVLSNPYDIMYDMIKKPWRFDFKEVKRACCGTGIFEMSYACKIADLKDEDFVCKDRSSYMFFDSFHPTERANKLIVDYFVNGALTAFSRG